MSNMRMKHKLIMSMMAGMIIIPGSVVRTQAAETDDSEKSLVPVTGIENILEASYQTEIKNNINLYLVPTEEGEYLNIAFSNTGDYTYIRSEADENSEWVGKLYSDSAVVVLEYLDGWTKIRSGNAEGYVPTETLFTGECYSHSRLSECQRRTWDRYYRINPDRSGRRISCDSRSCRWLVSDTGR